MAINVTGQRSMVFEACCRCGQEQRQQNMCCHELAGEERWFCLDCAIDVSTSLLADVRDLAKVREMADRVHGERDAAVGAYHALALMVGQAG